MEVIQMKREVTPPQDIPIDLTKSTEHYKVSSYPQLTHKTWRTHPHIRYPGSKSADPIPESHYEPLKNHSLQNDRTSPVIHFTPHPKKRKFTQDPEDGPVTKKQKENNTKSFNTQETEAEWLKWSKTYSPCALPSLAHNHFARAQETPSSYVDKERFLAGVNHFNNMLYFSFYSHWLQTLQAKQLLDEQREHGLELYEKSAKIQEPPRLPVWEPPVLHSPKKAPPKEDIKSSPSSSSPVSSSISHLPQQQQQALPRKQLEEKRFYNLNEDSPGLLGRKRAPRALTGKHVRPGTGASPITLMTLRQKLALKKQRKDEPRLHERKTNLIKKK